MQGDRGAETTLDTASRVSSIPQLPINTVRVFLVCLLLLELLLSASFSLSFMYCFFTHQSLGFLIVSGSSYSNFYFLPYGSDHVHKSTHPHTMKFLILLVLIFPNLKFQERKLNYLLLPFHTTWALSAKD